MMEPTIQGAEPCADLRIVRYDDGDVKDVYSEQVDAVHLERMDDDHVWVAVYLKDGRRVVVNMYSHTRRSIKGTVEIERYEVE